MADRVMWERELIGHQGVWEREMGASDEPPAGDGWTRAPHATGSRAARLAWELFDEILFYEYRLAQEYGDQEDDLAELRAEIEEVFGPPGCPVGHSPTLIGDAFTDNLPEIVRWLNENHIGGADENAGRVWRLTDGQEPRP